MRNLLRALLPKKSPKAPRRTARPELEGLEERAVPTVTNHGGALLANVKVQGLYIGDQWVSNPTLSGQFSYLENFLRTIVNSTYMDALSNAGYGAGRGSFTGGRISLASLSAGSRLDDNTVQNWLSSYISSHVLQSADANTLYVCFVEPNVWVRQGNSSSANFRGYHTAIWTPQAGLIRYAVVTYPGGTVGNAGVPFLSSIDSVTKTASHEIAEAVTDPDAGFSTLGWYDDARNGEIGDINNDRVMYVNGFAMQRIVNKNDFNMTPAQATSSRAVNFALKSNGDLLEFTAGGYSALAGGMAALSDQGIDNQGRAMVDVVSPDGNAWEYHDAYGWTYLGGGIKSAKAGQGVSYLLYSDGSIREYDDATGSTGYLYSGGSKIDAGTDVQGVNAVDVVFTWGDAWERSDDTSWHFIASGVQSVSAGRLGICDYLTTDGAAHWHHELGSDATLAGGVSQVTAGTDANGNYMIDLLYANGDLWEYRAGGAWTYLGGGNGQISKANAGAITEINPWTDFDTHDASGWHYWTSYVVMAA
jgi:hypothetical protein